MKNKIFAIVEKSATIGLFSCIMLMVIIGKVPYCWGFFLLALYPLVEYIKSIAHSLSEINNKTPNKVPKSVNINDKEIISMDIKIKTEDGHMGTFTIESKEHLQYLVSDLVHALTDKQ